MKAPRSATTRSALRVVGLVALWLLAWGDLSVANVVSGVLVAVGLLVAFPVAADGHARFHPIGGLRLGGFVVRQLVVSNVIMALQILGPRRRFRPGVLAHPLQIPSDLTVTLMAGVISLSPGTMTADVAPDASAIYVHFFDLSDIEASRRTLAHLEHLVVGATGGRTRPADGVEVAR